MAFLTAGACQAAFGGIYTNYEVQTQITTGSQTLGDIWCQWNQPYTTQPTTTSNVTYQNVWAGWNTDYYQVNAQRISAAEAAQAQLELSQQYQREKIRAAEAETKAEALLMLYLTSEQQKQYKSVGYFETSINDRRYRLKRGRAGNILELDKNGKPVAKLCVHPVGYLPESDNVLTQLLALLADEEAVRATANHTRL